MHDYQTAQKLNLERPLPREPSNVTHDGECRKQKRSHLVRQKTGANKMTPPRARRVRNEMPFVKNRDRTNVQV
jgi:hypothetical protein